MDEEAIAAGKVLAAQDKRFHIHYSPFSAMFKVLTQPGLAKGSKTEGNFVDGVLIDIGISSPQLDGSRGFRPEDTYDSPLDMRFDQRPHVESALQFVQRVGRHQLASCIEHYGGEHPLAARRIADAIALAKASGSLPTRTAAFGALVANAKGHEYQAMHPAKMTFQALRIQVNQEYDELRGGLEASMKLLKDGGKTAVLTWKHTECAILVDHARKHEVSKGGGGEGGGEEEVLLPVKRYLEPSAQRPFSFLAFDLTFERSFNLWSFYKSSFSFIFLLNACLCGSFRCLFYRWPCRRRHFANGWSLT